MFFSNPFQRSFLEGPSADLNSKVRLWNHFGFRGLPKAVPWSIIFGQKSPKGDVVLVAVSVPGPTRATRNVARATLRVARRIFDDFYRNFATF